MGKVTIIVYPLILISLGCATIHSPIPEEDKRKVRVTARVESYCEGCEHFSGTDFEGNFVTWWEDEIQLTVIEPVEFKEKTLTLKNDLDNEIREEWKQVGNLLSFDLELQFLKSPYIQKNGIESYTYSYVYKDIEESLEIHNKAVDQ